MAETLTTLAFLSALAMLISPIFEKGEWLASITAALCGLAFFSLPFDSIQQSGGLVLVIVLSMCCLIQYRIKSGGIRKYLNGMSGGIILLLLLALYPEEGVYESVNEYTTSSNLQEFVKAVIIGLLLAQLLVNSVSFDGRMSLLMLVTIIILQLGAQIFNGEILSVIISSAILIGFMPYFEQKINPKIGSGQGRSLALGASTLIGIIFILALTYVSISNVDRIGSDNGAIAVSLWLVVAVTGIGLLGMLLPLLGFDSHPRPEAWGWRFGIALSPMLLTLQTDLANHVLLGVLIAMMVSVSSPLVLEKNSTKVG
ncbi:MAG: hypothetical protein DWC02_05020 [Candidatus Poseidoniales archaeon]|nr:MAG: hypothetical protein DWC02_05020 [Candidatus Poseidoniales archaeon]